MRTNNDFPIVLFLLSVFLILILISAFVYLSNRQPEYPTPSPSGNSFEPTYRITFNDNQVIEVDYMRCVAEGYFVNCYDDVFSSPKMSYSNVASVERIDE